MERLTGSSTGRDATQRHLDAARAALRSLDDMASPEGVTLSGKIVSHYLTVALDELSGMDQQVSIDSSTPPDPLRVACTFCGRMIMPSATLCGFCWRRRGGPATA
jgi:hypothetical protein